MAKKTTRPEKHPEESPFFKAHPLDVFTQAPRPIADALREWIFQELGKREEDVDTVTYCREMIELPGDEEGWRCYEPGTRIVFVVTFFGEERAYLLHVENNVRSPERPSWYLDHNGVTPLNPVI